jgi:hypothetical protein
LSTILIARDATTTDRHQAKRAATIISNLARDLCRGYDAREFDDLVVRDDPTLW